MSYVYDVVRPDVRRRHTKSYVPYVRRRMLQCTYDVIKSYNVVRLITISYAVHRMRCRMSWTAHRMLCRMRHRIRCLHCFALGIHNSAFCYRALF